MPRPKNTGLILEPPKARDWRFGGVSGGVREVLASDGQWDDYLPSYETQRKFSLEVMGCVSFSLCNCLEIYAKAAFGVEPNYSDRWLATISETTKRGNTFWKVAMASHKQGLANETTWEWTEDVDTWDEYYATPPGEARNSAMRFLEKWNTLFEWVDPKPETMMEAMKYGPLQACSNGHAYTIFGFDPGVKWKIFDTYPYSGGTGVREVDWGHKFLATMLHTVEERTAAEPEPLLELPNDCMVFEAGGPGRAGLHVNKKLFVDDVSKIQFQWVMRNETDGMFVGGPVRSIAQEEFIKFPKTDLKGNPLE